MLSVASVDRSLEVENHIQEAFKIISESLEVRKYAKRYKMIFTISQSHSLNISLNSYSKTSVFDVKECTKTAEFSNSNCRANN